MATADNHIREGKRNAKEALLSELRSQNRYIEHGDPISDVTLDDLFATNRSLLSSLRLRAASSIATLARVLMKSLAEGNLQIVSLITSDNPHIDFKEIQAP